MKVIVDYDYIYNLIDYIASGNGDYDYLITIDYDYTNPDVDIPWLIILTGSYLA